MVLAVNGDILWNVRDEIVQYDIDKLILISPLMNDAFLNEAGKILSDKSRISNGAFISDDVQIVADDTSSIIIDDDVVIGNGCVIIASDNSHIHIGKRSVICEECSIIVSNNSRIELENYVYISKHCGICIVNNGYICLGENNKIGESIDLTAKNNSVIRFGNKVQVGRSGKIYACDFGEINIEKGSTFCEYLYMDSEKSQIYIGEDCMFSHYVRLNVGSHRLINKNDGTDITNKTSIIIGNRVWGGIGITIMPGCQIGDGSVIGASSLVNNEIPSNCTCAGNPAKVLRSNIEWFRK